MNLDNIIENFNEINVISDFEKSEIIKEIKERKISSLNPEQIEKFTKFILTCSDEEIKNYNKHILDIEYELLSPSIENKIVEKFLADKRFNKIRNIIFEETGKPDPIYSKHISKIIRKCIKED